MLPDISIRQLEYLVAVDGHPTWAAAADAVGVSPSALSQGLAELERRVGVPLFDRDGRRRALRPAAAPVLDHARRVVALTGDLAGWADRVRTGRSGRLPRRHDRRRRRRSPSRDPPAVPTRSPRARAAAPSRAVGRPARRTRGRRARPRRLCRAPSRPARGRDRGVVARRPRRLHTDRTPAPSPGRLGPVGVVRRGFPHPGRHRGRPRGGRCAARPGRRVEPARGAPHDGRTRSGFSTVLPVVQAGDGVRAGPHRRPTATGRWPPGAGAVRSTLLSIMLVAELRATPVG